MPPKRFVLCNQVSYHEIFPLKGTEDIEQIIFAKNNMHVFPCLLRPYLRRKLLRTSYAPRICHVRTLPCQVDNTVAEPSLVFFFRVSKST